MSLRLADHWLWDVWFAVDGDTAHVFYLHAPHSLGDPERRHQHARIGHATSRDLRHWEVGAPIFPEPAPGAADDRATWTGSVMADPGGGWRMFYTGVSSREDGQVQRIVSATSPDLTHWHRTDLVLEADARWYEKWTPELPEEHWRDPWVWRDPATGLWHLYVTARAAEGDLDARGVIGHAVSADLEHWKVGPPLSAPGELRQLEVPQLLRAGQEWQILFCAGAADHGARRLARPGTERESGVHMLRGPTPLGPFSLDGDRFLLGYPEGVAGLYAARLVEFGGTEWLLGWSTHDADGSFAGWLADPMPVTRDATGRLLLP